MGISQYTSQYVIEGSVGLAGIILVILGLVRNPAPTDSLQLYQLTGFQYALYLFCHIVYNVYLHPLARFPGPKLRAATHIPYYWDMWKGTMPHVARSLHDQYGDTVRISPTGLSFSSPQAWKDIYGIRPGKPQLPKDPAFYFPQKEGPSIFISGDADHSRMRRLLSHAFSERAMREQAPLVSRYYDLLIRKLHEEIQGPAGGKVDVVKWYNCCTFDVIGDLTFGEPFGSLEKGGYHFWIANIFKALKMTQEVRIGKAYPLFTWYLSLRAKLHPTSSEARAKHAQFSAESAEKRLALNTDRKDFMSYILQHNDEKGMSVSEIKQNSKIMVLAGSETTATLLSGATYFLCTNPDALRKVTAEVRRAFSNGSEIILTSATHLPYLQAVIDESLRMYPPVPSTLPRRTLPGGDVVNGQSIPSQTSVGVNQWATNRSARNFRDPDIFIPDRWLGDPRYATDSRDAVQPFSVGPRNCLGKNLALAEIRSILARMLWNFDLELCPESREWTRQKVFFMWDKPSLWVVLRKAPARGEREEVGGESSGEQGAVSLGQGKQRACSF